MAVSKVKDIAGELPAILTADHIQKALGLSRGKTYDLLHRADFPAILFGRAIRIPRDAFLRWLDAQARHASEEHDG